MRKLNSILISYLLLDITCYCNGDTDSLYMDYDHRQIPYQLYKPDAVLSLDQDLQEISGLSMDGNGHLAAIEDENGVLYILNTENGEIIRKVRFDKKGDYEGVEIINGTAYVIKSDGDLFTFPSSGQEKYATIITDTPFSADNNIEGLGYDGKYLLMACKEESDINEIELNGQAIYPYDSKAEKIPREAAFVIEEKQLQDHLNKNKYFNQLGEFNPSAVAVHPLTSDVYVLSADNILVVFTSGHQIREVARLDEKLYSQAEGICFSPDGALFISSEGNDTSGKIFKFLPIPKGK